MKKVFSVEKYVESMYKGDYEKAMKSFSDNPSERKWVFNCDNKTLDDCEKMGYAIDLDWCKLVAENELDKEIIRFINKYGFTDYQIFYSDYYNKIMFSVMFLDDGIISGEESCVIIRPSWYDVDGFEIDETSIIIKDIEKIQKLLIKKVK